MRVCCLDDFKVEFEKLKSNNSYKDIGKEIITYFFDKTYDDLCNGTKLNGASKIPYIKKRLKGSGGYRVYFLLIIKNDSVYLMFVHPKTGSKGAGNISSDFQAALLKKIHECIIANNYFIVETNEKNDDLLFTSSDGKSITEKPLIFRKSIDNVD